MSEVVIISGYPASGKSTLVEDYVKQGYHRLNRDEIVAAGGKASIGVMHAMLDKMIGDGKHGTKFVLDNLYGTKEHRAQVIEVAKKHKIPIRCVWVTTSIEDAQFNASLRMIRKFGRLLNPKLGTEPDEFAKFGAKDNAAIPPAVLFNYRKEFEKPTTAEGFAKVDAVPFVRKTDPAYTNKAIIIDYDGTVRTCNGGNGKYPVKPSEVQIIPGVADVLKAYKAQGYILLGASNQSGIAKGDLTDAEARACFDRTNELLGLDIDVMYCPHRVGPPVGIGCYCRKPMPGMGVHFIEKYKLDASKTVMVGDMKTDSTFAARCGFQFINDQLFFAGKAKPK